MALMIAAATAAMTAPARGNAKLQLADLRKAVSLLSPQFSPDGRRVAVIVRRRDYVKNKLVDDVVLIDVRTHAARTIVHAMRAEEFAWSPAGNEIAFIAAPLDDDSKTPQLFSLPMNGGEPVQLSHAKNGVSDFAWRPDSRALAFVSEADAPNAKAIEEHDNAFNVTDDAWTAQRAPVPDELYEVALSGGEPHRITAWRWSVAGGFTYTGDGANLLVTRTKPDAHPNRYLATEIVRVNVRDGRVAPIPTLSLQQNSPIRSDDGRYVAYSFANPSGTMQSEAALAGPDGQNPRFVTRRLDRDVEIMGFDGADNLVLVANDHTKRRIYRVEPDSTIESYPVGSLVPSQAAAAHDGSLAFTASAPDRLTELYLLPPHGATPVRLTHYNDWLDAYALGSTHTIVWRSADGFKPDGVLVAPPHWQRGQRAPLVLVIHGGPTAASTIGFNGFAQILAAHGWFVFMPNYRGSDNLGLAFARTTVPKIASVPGQDIEDGLNAVLALGVVDPSRIGVSGWSEGGLMTSWLIGHDTRWKAAVSGAAVNDWLGYDAMTDAKDFTPQFIGPKQWTDPALLRTFEAESPLTYASKVRTPTLILSDAGDFRVPTPLSYEFYHDVRATGTTVQFVIYPVNGHFPSDPIRGEDVNRRWEAWFAKYL